MLTPNHGIINTYTANHQRVAYKQQEGIAKPPPSRPRTGQLLWRIIIIYQDQESISRRHRKISKDDETARQQDSHPRHYYNDARKKQTIRSKVIRTITETSTKKPKSQTRTESKRTSNHRINHHIIIMNHGYIIIAYANTSSASTPYVL